MAGMAAAPARHDRVPSRRGAVAPLALAANLAAAAAAMRDLPRGLLPKTEKLGKYRRAEGVRRGFGRMMRFLHVVRSLRPETGGVAEMLRNLAQAQQRRGDHVTIVSLDPADDGADAVEGAPETVVLGRRSHGYGQTARLVPWLRRHGAEFDIVVVHGLWQYQSFAVWRALRGGKVPYLVFPHGMLDVWFKRAHPLKHAKKWLYWPWAEYRVLRDAAAVCYTAEEERRRARESFWLYRARERVLPIGIQAPAGDPAREREEFFAAHPVLRGRSFLLFLGRIHPKKGVDLLLRAYAAVMRDAGDPLLVIAGPCADEAYRAGLQAEAAALGLTSRVHWLPMLSGAVKWGALRSCEAFALFSHQENFGIAVAEALACARPVLLSTEVAIWREIVDDGAGLAGPDDEAGSRATLTRWREWAPAQRQVAGEAAQRCFAQRYEVVAATAALEAAVRALSTPS